MQATLQKPEEIIALFDALGREERWGELNFQGGDGNSKMFLIQGRIAWAFTSNQRESFQTILIQEDGYTKENLLGGIKSARESGNRQLDDILRHLGVGDTNRRLEIVVRHIISALEAIIAMGEVHVSFRAMAPAAHLHPQQAIPIRELLPALQQPKKPAPQPRNKPNYQADLAAAAVKDIPEILERLRFEIPSFLAAMVVESKTSMPVATLSDAPGLDIEIAGAFYRDLIRSAMEAMKAVGKSSKNPLEEVVISSNDDFVILRNLRDGDHFLYLLLDQDSNPGMAKVAVRRYYEQLNALLG